MVSLKYSKLGLPIQCMMRATSKNSSIHKSFNSSLLSSTQIRYTTLCEGKRFISDPSVTVQQASRIHMEQHNMRGYSQQPEKEDLQQDNDSNEQKNNNSSNYSSKIIGLIAGTGVMGLLIWQLVSRKTDDAMETDESIERNKTHDKPFHYDEKVAHLKQEIEEALENERPKSLWQRVVFATRVLLRSLTLVIRSVPVIFYSTYLRLFPNSEYVKKSYYTYVLNTLRALGPVYIKLGQWMATRPDLFDEELTEVLGELHSFGTIHDHDESIQAIERCFGKPIDEIFESIDEQCIGSGAIAQVYRAKSKTFGDVAVKVRHPNLLRNMYLDLTILFPLLKLLVPKSLNLDANFSEFAESMLNQVDMRFEAYNNQHFLHTFRHSSEIVFAKPLSCSEEVIVSTFEEGDDVSTWLARPENTFSKAEHVRKLIASLGNAMYLKMVLVDNFMHGDLHPGNMKIRQNDEGHYEIVVLDTGIVYRLSNESKNDLVNIFISVSEKDGVALAHFLSKRGHPAREEFDRYVLNEKNGRFTSYSDQLNPVYRAYQEKMSKHLDTILSTPHAEIQAAYSFEKAIRIAREHGVEPETGFLHILLSTALIEGVARHINPQMEFVNDIKPTLRGIIKESDVLYRFVQRASSAKMKQLISNRMASSSSSSNNTV